MPLVDSEKVHSHIPEPKHLKLGGDQKVRVNMMENHRTVLKNKKKTLTYRTNKKSEVDQKVQTTWDDHWHHWRTTKKMRDAWHEKSYPWSFGA